MRIQKILAHMVWPFTSFLLLYLLWLFGAEYTALGEQIPNPADVLSQLVQSLFVPIGKYTLLGHVFYSLRRVLVGYGAALVLGVVTGIAMGWSKAAEAVCKPVFTIIRSIPSIAWIPLAILWFGVDEMSKYFIIGLAAYVTITANSYGGANAVDMQHVGAARMLGADERQVFMYIVLPSALPSIMAGMQVGISTSWMAMLAAEMIRSYEGLGWMIIMGMESANLVQIFVGIITTGLMGLILVSVLKLLERRIYRWKRESS